MILKRLSQSLVLCLICFCLSVQFFIQSVHAQKKDLLPEDYNQWQSITNTAFSPNGEWFAYNINLVEGDGWLTLKKVGTDSTGEHTFMNGISPQFSNNNRWFAFRIGVSEEKERELKERNESVQFDLGLMDLSSAKVDTFKNISQFEFSDTGRHLLMRKYKPDETETEGMDVVLRHLETDTNQLIGNVVESAFNEDGTLLAYLLGAHEKLGNGVHLITLSDAATHVLDSDTVQYTSLTWNEDGTGIAFMKSIPDENYEENTHQVYAYPDVKEDITAQIFNPSNRDLFPEDHRIVDYRSLEWSEDGDRLFFGIKEWEKIDEAKPDTAESNKSDEDEEEEEEEEEREEDPDAHLDPTNVEIWHWQDDQIQPRQKVMRQNLEQSNFLSAWHLEDDRFVQLMDNHNHTLTLTGDQKFAVLYDPEPYQPRFREGWNDVYLVDASDASRTKVLERQEFVQVSPDGGYLLYFREDDWWSYDITADTHTNLTENIDTKFNNYTYISGRENDRAFGSGQWSENDQWVLLYDEFDIYKVTPDGQNEDRLTQGKEDEIRYRQVRLDFEEDALSSDQPFYVSMFGNRTKDRGYARVDQQNRVETLIYEPKMINRLSKADSSDLFVYQSQTATDSPDFYHVDNSFEGPAVLTNTNPQQENYHWADDELISFTNARGEVLEGRLLYPANYNPEKQYPMMVYIYERRSQTLHYYSSPTRTSPYNQRRFSSEGYFVFEPDITYELKRPGMSAVESVVPAVEQVLKTGRIDAEKIGLTGHSWGAYQTSFIITQTDLFASAVAGAPLTNMISMYNSVYWNSGMTDATIFEVSQGRYPDPYWQDWENFVENSPIFNMQQTQTPLLVEFGTDDGAVDFNQGVELYNTMRRMQKPFVMLVYEGENHGLARRENQIDYATRAFEWHDHFLLGNEPASWIIEGLPYIERPEIIETD